ncbi:MAG TPA: M48 family metalloprotease [Bryobacteraceae bacterium]|nr:M48 family metalloprotease [Bryobacteraceae bacterium]
MRRSLLVPKFAGARPRISQIAALLGITAALALADTTGERAVDRLIDNVISQEQSLVDELKKKSPIVETYIQESAGEASPERMHQDHYFLGRLQFSASAMEYVSIADRSGQQKPSRLWRFGGGPVMYQPSGFAQMIFIDLNDFDRSIYGFEYVRREFLGEVRTLVFDIAPLQKTSGGRFVGRIWVEDKTFAIVRFNGTYTKSKSSQVYYHFDSWRTHLGDRWMPAFVYVEESADQKKASSGASFKAQTRVWGYTSGKPARLDELTSILVEMEKPGGDKEIATDVSPLESQRSWERQAEENITDRLEKSGLLAPKGSVDQVLNTVINNLIATNSLSVDAQCRVLLSTPLETFTVGRTIVISRGLIDVLPDEASLAMVLAAELAHVALGHRTNTQFAFHNQTMFSDEQLLERFRFARSETDTTAAGNKAVELLMNSPYKEKMSNAGLFLKALVSRAPHFPNLIHANLGNQLAKGETLVRLGDLASNAPMLEDDKLEQIAALPLGSRVRLDPWTSTIALVKTKPISLLSAREKMAFEITPFAPHLTRLKGETAPESENRTADSAASTGVPGAGQ